MGAGEGEELQEKRKGHELDHRRAAGVLEEVQEKKEPDFINPRAYSKWPLARVIQAAHEGDLQLLSKMLDREDPINGFHHDLNKHHDGFNALHAAAANGQLEAVQLLLAARADPHVKRSVALGVDPATGQTARELAEKWGWDDIVGVLRQAELETPKGLYRKYGANNNAKLYPIDRPEGLDPEQERRAKERHKAMTKPLPNRAERKFYGDLVFGVNFGWDQYGKVIKMQAPESNLSIGEGEPPSSLPGPAEPRLALLFPGGPFIGKMSVAKARMESAAEFPVVQKLLETAKALGINLSTATRLTDLLVLSYILNVVALERYRQARPEAAQSPGAVAGLFVGEFNALAAAGVFSPDTGLLLLKALGESMEEVGKSEPQASMSVAGLDRALVQELCAEVRTKHAQPCFLSNELFPKGYTCAGTKKGMELLRTLAMSHQAKQVKLLENFLAFQTELMAPAQRQLEAALGELLPQMMPNRIDVYLNSTGGVLPRGTDPKDILGPFCAQVTSPALWESSLRSMIASGLEDFVEVGPAGMLKSMMKFTSVTAYDRMTHVEM